jgi:formylglycine-generating enzyme required for sulfatase activity
MQLQGEKLNLNAETRRRVEDAVVESLRSHDEETFRAAGEAWLHLQQQSNYHRLDEEKQISGWVTKAEFQMFLLAPAGAVELSRHIPPDWHGGWFAGDAKEPVLGVSSGLAHAYCTWLNAN